MTIAEERPQIWKPFALREEELEPLGDFNYAASAGCGAAFTLLGLCRN